MSERTVHVFIKGRVQGVGYRAWTEDTAAELKIRGWVRNRRDGSVEAVFSGADAAIAEILERCRTGSRAARVDDITVTERADSADIPSAFEFRPTTV